MTFIEGNGQDVTLAFLFLIFYNSFQTNKMPIISIF